MDDGEGGLSSGWKRWGPDLLWTLPFVVLLWVNIAHHVLWFDESNAWAIVAGSPSFGKLLYFVHFEAHPWLWYGLLYGPSRLTHSPVAMKCVEAAIGTAVYLMLGLASPFRRVEKLLIFLGYFVVFEYTVMSRMYGLMLLLALVFCWRRLRRPDAVVGNVALLGLMANTDLTGVLLAGALLLQYGYELWEARRAGGWTTAQKRAAGVAVGVFVLMLGVSIYSLIPSPDISWQASGHMGAEALQPRRLVQSVGNMVASPWWPISRDFPRRFWATDVMVNRWLLGLVPLVLWAYWRAFRGERSLQLLMGLTLGFGVLFADVVYAGRVRHWGIAVVAFLVGLWMQRVRRERAGEPTRWGAWTYGLMGLGALAGVFALVGASLHPFSESKAAADWIRANEPANVALVGQWDLNFASVGEQLGRPMYFMECGCTDTMKLFARERDSYPAAELPDRLRRAMQALRTSDLVMVNFLPMTGETLTELRGAGFGVTPLARFVGAEDDHESFYLYKVARDAGPLEQ